MIHALYEQAALLHGHKCPGLAIGVRAAVEGMRLLEIQDIQDKDWFCVAENRACYLDGIQAVAGCTFGKGNLIYRPTGKTAFSFYHNGRAVRLVMRELDFSGDRDAMTEYILTAPFSQLFLAGQPLAALPEREAHSPRLACSVCGETAEEHAMRVKDGKPVCIDCARG